MTFAELKTELYARGTDYLSEDAAGVTRAERWLNQGYREICAVQPWVFLEATVTGSAAGTGLSIPDLRRIVYIKHVATGMPLRPVQMRELVNDSVDLDYAGDPQFYYFTSDVLIKTVPTNSDSIEVRYIKRVAPMTGTDSPLFDEEYHNLIVDKAMVRAYIDGDNYEAAAALKAEIGETINAMREDYSLTSSEPGYIRIVDPYDG